MKKEAKVKVACCSTRQKIWGVIALVGLFACGWMAAVAINANEPGHANESCKVIEDFLLGRINPINSDQISKHSENIDIYKVLIENGCPASVDKYNAALQRESAIIEILKNNEAIQREYAPMANPVPNKTQTCAEIEQLLTKRLDYYPNDAQDSDTHIERAKIYANLSERGCAEHSAGYVNLASKELEIARALSDDKFNEPETLGVVETYKRLEMKQAANEVLEKVQKLTDPAIDFILQVQKIIEE